MLQKNAGSRGGEDGRYYHEDVLRILQHQYISLRHPEEASQLVQYIHGHNVIYISGKELGRNTLFSRIFKPMQNPGEIAAYLLEILEIITGVEENGAKPMPALELEFIYRIYTRIKRLGDVLGRLELSYGLPTFLRIFQRYLQRTRIPFSGEPLAGLQVMGVLETRVLDFRKIIILSMNEGTFPKSTASPSFIPYNLRKGFGLPTPDHQDAIYAYYFYRLVQRAEQVSMVYNNRSEGLSTGERSRYIYQMQYDPVFSVKEKSMGFDLKSRETQVISVEKNSGHMDQLAGYHDEDDNGNYLSPSALNTLINCSLKFYFRYIASLKEPDQLSEEVDAAMFGNLLHDVMKTIYESMKWSVEKENIEKILQDEPRIRDMVDSSIIQLFRTETGGQIEGGMLIIEDIMLSYIKRILEIDMLACPLEIHSLEKKYSTRFPVKSGGNELNVKISGKIDRIDVREGKYRVLDYKSGKGTLHFRSVGELFDGQVRNRNEGAFQTFLYSKIFSESREGGTLPVKPGLYIARSLFKGGYSPDLGMGTASNNVKVEDYSEHNREFSEYLKGLLEDLFNRELPFQQTTQEEHCKYCEFKEICHR